MCRVAGPERRPRQHVALTVMAKRLVNACRSTILGVVVVAIGRIASTSGAADVIGQVRRRPVEYDLVGVGGVPVRIR